MEPRGNAVAGGATRALRTLVLGLCLAMPLGSGPRAAGDALLRCPSGVVPACVPGLVGTAVLCEQGGAHRAYEGISHYCLNCHAGSRRMVFEHPYEIPYPVSGKEFRARSGLQPGISLNMGLLTCVSCHSGDQPGDHYLVELSGAAYFCDHCHLTGMVCPKMPGDRHSACFPGTLNGQVRCVWGEFERAFPTASDYCAGCHDGHERIARSHPVEVQYPHNRAGYVPISQLEPRIRLVDGRMTCESCHAMVERGYWTCRSCHIK